MFDWLTTAILLATDELTQAAVILAASAALAFIP